MSETDKEILKSISLNDGGVNMEIEGGACGAIANSFVDQFIENGAVNYLEMSFHNEELGQITVTVQRTDGVTPAQRITELEEALRQIRNLDSDRMDEGSHIAQQALKENK